MILKKILRFFLRLIGLYPGATRPPNLNGRFRKLFPSIPHFDFIDAFLIELGKKGGVMDAGAHGGGAVSATIPAGMTFFAQFIDHDITFDPTTSNVRQGDPDEIEYFRTPALELDSLYGSGPALSPALYDKTNKAKLLLSEDGDDLPRNPQGTALIGDPRNDENFFISQLHVAFARFHNKMVDYLVESELADASNVFERAQEQVRWHYQWLIVNEFLPKIIGQDLVDDILEEGPMYYMVPVRREGVYGPGLPQLYIPIEFVAAAFQFRHSLLPQTFTIAGKDVDLFRESDEPPTEGISPGFSAPPDDMTAVWKDLFEIDPDDPPQYASKIDTHLASTLFELPYIDAPAEEYERSLAARLLLGGNALELPSGERLAYVLAVEPLTRQELDLDAVFEAAGSRYIDNTPLWYYILREAAVRGDGEQLGEVGGRIVGETLLGLLLNDPKSYLVANPAWEPLATVRGEDGVFTMADLLIFAGVAPNPATVRTHTVRRGESLVSISVLYYGVQARWRDIWEANRDVIGDNPSVIQPGMVLQIPE